MSDQDGIKSYQISHQDPVNCLFCDYKPSPTEDLDGHYINCKMRPLCDLIVEQQFKTQHMVIKCQQRKSVKICPRCAECIVIAQYDNHISRKKCRESKRPDMRCTTCHEDVTDWKKHLLIEGCDKKF